MEVSPEVEQNKSTHKKSKKVSERAIKLREKRERKALQEAMRKCQEKCDETIAILYPAGKNAEPNYTKAKVVLESGLEFYKDNAQLYYLLGECYSGMKNIKDAIMQYSIALDKDARYVSALQARAQCYYWLKDYTHAAEDCTSTIQIEPGNDHAFNMRGLCLFEERVPGLRLRRELYESCVNNFKRATELNQANYHAYVNLAAVYEQQGELIEAVQAYTEALRARNDYTYAKFRRACTYLSLAELIDCKYNFTFANTEKEVTLPNATVTVQEKNQLASKYENSTLRENVLDQQNCKQEELELTISKDIQKEREYEKAHAEYINFLHKAEEDFVSLLPVSSDSNKLLVDPMITLKLFDCALKEKQLSKAEKYLRWSSDILAARSGLVSEGLASPFEDEKMIAEVISISKAKLQEASEMKVEPSHINLEKRMIVKFPVNE